MKIFFIKKSTLYKISIIIIAIIVLVSLVSILSKDKAINTFKQDGEVYYKGNVDEKVIAFTCNVDWGNEYIPKMLNVFENNDIKITFFVTGRWAEKNNDLLKEIYDHGHEIGNHGYSHKDYGKMDYQSNKQQIYNTDNIIKKALNIETNLFAPPAGAYNDDTIKAANDLGYNVIMWSIDTIDWRKDSTCDKIVNRVVSRAKNSAIVLMHPKKETLKALPIIIQSLNDQGYKVGKVSDIVK